jgi:hypothetical protein
MLVILADFVCQNISYAYIYSVLPPYISAKANVLVKSAHRATKACFLNRLINALIMSDTYAIVRYYYSI